jgi:hypothetical protein
MSSDGFGQWTPADLEVACRSLDPMPVFHTREHLYTKLHSKLNDGLLYSKVLRQEKPLLWDENGELFNATEFRSKGLYFHLVFSGRKELSSVQALCSLFFRFC